MPIASAMLLIVLAVNMPPHAPSPGHAERSISPSSSSVILPNAQAPTASNTLVMSVATPWWLPGMVDPLYTNTLGRSSLAAAISMPGMLLSQPARPTNPSSRSACITHSTESVMTSRDTSDARMPS